MNIPDRLPDYSHDEGELRMWFSEMFAHCKITTTGNLYSCKLILSLDKKMSLVVPDDFKCGGIMMILSKIEPGVVLPMSDDINDAYWRWVAEQSLLEACDESYQCKDHV